MGALTFLAFFALASIKASGILCEQCHSATVLVVALRDAGNRLRTIGLWPLGHGSFLSWIVHTTSRMHGATPTL